MPIRRPSLRSLAVCVVGLTLAIPLLRAGDVASDDGLPPLDVKQAVQFAVPPVVRPNAPYKLAVTFAGNFEQNVDLFVWVSDTNSTGHWQRRAFVNSYWQGGESASTLPLESGRTYALAMHRIDAPAPAYGRPFVQSTLTKADPVSDAADALPTVHAEFASGQAGDTVIELQPATKP